MRRNEARNGNMFSTAMHGNIAEQIQPGDGEIDQGYTPIDGRGNVQAGSAEVVTASAPRPTE